MLIYLFTRLGSEDYQMSPVDIMPVTPVPGLAPPAQGTYKILFLSHLVYPGHCACLPVLKKQLHNPPKGYFIDPGLIREIGFFHSEDNGRLLENLFLLS